MKRVRSFLGVFVAGQFFLACAQFSVELPPDRPVQSIQWLEQGWTEGQRQWFHHASQGTATLPVPYEWLLALEQPNLTLFAAPLLVDPVYLRRFGFIASPKSEGNPDALPIGFARTADVVDPSSGTSFQAIGFTCAACHTGQLDYRETGLRYDGGPAVTDLGKFRKALGLAVVFTKYIPGRFSRFAERILGKDHTNAAEESLRQQLASLVTTLKHLERNETKFAKQNVEEGFTRLDALSRIGNEVFGRQLNNDENYQAILAPVNYPPLWDAPWFDWVQYNGAIEQPMFRNAGEALGVSALVNLTETQRPLFASTVQVDTLYELEKALAGAAPLPARRFSGLRAPTWPEEVLGKIDRALAQQGAHLYGELCQGCHLPAPNTEAFWDAHLWSAPNAAGESYLKLHLIPIAALGTDPMQATGMAERKVQVPAHLGITETSFGLVLQTVVMKTVTYWYDQQHTTPERRMEMNGNRGDRVQAPLAYRARPLDGIWATPPFLHNGSVPSLYALLSPVSERATTFYLGSREFDPQNVGFDPTPLKGGFKFNTSIPGNWNTGHEFNHDTKGKGVIGRYLEPEERRALIEYLKTL
jgi:mono/diheme cytochrome c family protein